MTLPDLLLTRVQGLSPRVRKVVYDVVLFVAAVLAVLTWGLPILDVDHLGPVELDELAQVAIAAAAAAALLARLFVPAAGETVQAIAASPDGSLPAGWPTGSVPPDGIGTAYVDRTDRPWQRDEPTAPDDGEPQHRRDA